MPDLRAITAGGATWDDPSPARVAALLGEVDRDAGGGFLIVERCADSSGQTYIQAMHDDGGYVVEYRDGSVDRHYRADAPDLGAARAVLAAWSTDAPTWRDMLPWQRLRRRSWLSRHLTSGYGI